VSAASDLWYSAALSELRQGEACAAKSDWRGAYARYGTAVEFLLKAIYLRNTQQSQMPASHQTARSHNLAWMAKEAGIESDIGQLKGVQRAYWLTVRDWDQGRRYPNLPFPAADGRALKLALCNPTHGVWTWLLSLYQAS
jgi:hypothetical protein